MKKYKSVIFDIIVIAALIFSSLSLIIFPQVSVEAAKDGITMCLNIVIPSLFPFFVLASLSSGLGITQKVGKLCSPVMKPIFKLNGNCAIPLVLGMIGGYPVGTKAAAELYKSGQCTKSEAERLISFCNNSGPAFVFSIVGARIFKSAAAGAVIYVIHILSNILIGIVFAHLSKQKKTKFSRDTVMITPKRSSLSSAFISSVTSSFASMINISGFVIFFAVCISILKKSGLIGTVVSFLIKILPISRTQISPLISGMLEMTSGICAISLSDFTAAGAAAAVSFLLSWAGLSIHCQVLSVISDTDLSATPFFIGKIFHAIISAAISYIVFLKSPINVKAQTATVFLPDTLLGGKSQTILMIIFIAASLIFVRYLREKRYGKHNSNNV